MVRALPQTRQVAGPLRLRAPWADLVLLAAEGLACRPSRKRVAASAPAAGRPRQRPGQRQLLPSPGHGHVEQAAFFLDLVRGLGVGDGEHAFVDADDEDGVPLQALGCVQGGQGDALDGRCVLGLGALVELGDQVAQRRAWLSFAKILGQRDESS